MTPFKSRLKVSKSAYVPSWNAFKTNSSLPNSKVKLIRTSSCLKSNPFRKSFKLKDTRRRPSRTRSRHFKIGWQPKSSRTTTVRIQWLPRLRPSRISWWSRGSRQRIPRTIWLSRLARSRTRWVSKKTICKPGYSNKKVKYRSFRTWCKSWFMQAELKLQTHQFPK